MSAMDPYSLVGGLRSPGEALEQLVRQIYEVGVCDSKVFPDGGQDE